MPRRTSKFSVEHRFSEDGADDLVLATAAGKIRVRLHGASGTNAGILYVFGAGGGLGGPAGGLYERLARTFQRQGIASLQVDYRYPGELRPCVQDVLTGVAYLQSLAVGRIALVGHSFGGAVVIAAGVASPAVAAVAALSSQTGGADSVGLLSPKPLLLLHGGDDEILPPACSVSLYRAAKQPKEMFLYPGCKHGLDQCRDEIDRDLSGWLRRVLN